ncbi:MAG: DMT family transporter [Candidatus Binataceae bacterium]
MQPFKLMISSATVRTRSQSAFATGLVLAIASTVIAALQPVIVRYGALTIDPILFCAGSVTVAAICVAVVLSRRGELAILAERRYLPRLIGVSLAGTVATSLSLIYGLSHIDAVAAVVLLESEPIYSLVMASVFLGERPSVRQLIATAIILGGIASVFLGGRVFSPLWAAALVFATPLFWQTAHVLSLGVMPPLTPIDIVGGRYVYAAFVLTAILLFTNAPALRQLADPTIAVTVVFAGIAVYFFGSLTWYGAISRLSLAWTTAFVIPGVPILSVLFALIFLGEHVSTLELAGLAVAILGVVTLVFGADAHRPRRDNPAEALHQPLA